MNNDHPPASKLRKWLMGNKESTLPGLSIVWPDHLFFTGALILKAITPLRKKGSSHARLSLNHVQQLQQHSAICVCASASMKASCCSVVLRSQTQTDAQDLIACVSLGLATRDYSCSMCRSIVGHNHSKYYRDYHNNYCA